MTLKATLERIDFPYYVLPSAEMELKLLSIGIGDRSVELFYGDRIQQYGIQTMKEAVHSIDLPFRPIYASQLSEMLVTSLLHIRTRQEPATLSELRQEVQETLSQAEWQSESPYDFSTLTIKDHIFHIARNLTSESPHSLVAVDLANRETFLSAFAQLRLITPGDIAARKMLWQEWVRAHPDRV